MTKYFVRSFIVLLVLSLILATNPFNIPIKIFQTFNIPWYVVIITFWITGINLLILLSLLFYKRFKTKKFSIYKKYISYFPRLCRKFIAWIDKFIISNIDILVKVARNLVLIFFILLFIDLYFTNVYIFINLEWFAFTVFFINALALIYYSKTIKNKNSFARLTRSASVRFMRATACSNVS